jgi:hypothetical protein
VQSKTGNKTQQVAVNFRTGSRVYLRVAGPLKPGLAVQNLTASYKTNLNPIGAGSADVAYRVSNVGNVRLAAQQSVVVVTPWGMKRAAKAVVNVPELLPGQFVDLKATVPNVLPAIRLKATVEVDPVLPAGVSGPALTNVSKSVSFWAIPWVLIGLIVGLILLWRAYIWFSRRSKAGGSGKHGSHRRGPSSTPPSVKSPEPSLEDVIVP